MKPPQRVLIGVFVLPLLAVGLLILAGAGGVSRAQEQGAEKIAPLLREQLAYQPDPQIPNRQVRASYSQDLDYLEVPPYFGPAQGHSASGVTQSAIAYPLYSTPPEEQGQAAPLGYEVDLETIESLKANPPSLPGPTPVYIEDTSMLTQAPKPNAPIPIIDFAGIPDTGWIPPDHGLAVGPSHVVQMVNSSWRAFTKTGGAVTPLRPFCGYGGWWTNVLPPGVTHCFDPRAMYDQFSGRYVMLAAAKLDTTSQSWYLLATSWTSDLTGYWCVWALDATLDGSIPTNNWADYPVLALDNQAIYITSNQFQFGTDIFQYSKLRILGKAQLYNNTCGAVSWWDFWGLRNPDNSYAFTVQAAHTFGTPGVEYLVNSLSLGAVSSLYGRLLTP